MSKVTALSPAQRRMLREMTTDRRESTITPGGYLTAGRDASRWWRTVAILEKVGLLRNPTGTNIALLTDAGRALALDLLKQCADG